jgi:NADPH2:quinone reductase
MKAVVVKSPGAPEVLHFETVPKLGLPQGWVLIRIKAFGLNRSEIFTRQGLTPHVKFPRILGIECVGIAGQLHTGFGWDNDTARLHAGCCSERNSLQYGNS